MQFDPLFLQTIENLFASAVQSTVLYAYCRLKHLENLTQENKH